MSPSAPSILPISVPQVNAANTAANATAQSPPIATPAFRSFINHLHDQVRNGFAQRRPWAELVDRSAFTKPESLSEAVQRVRKNYSYFRVNYLSFVALVLAFSLLSHPGSLIILLALVAAWIFLYLFRPSDPPLVLFGRTFSERETLGILIVFSAIVVFLTSVGSVLISALMVGSAIVCAHGAFRVPEDLFLDEQVPEATGFLSFLGGTNQNTSAVATPAPAVAARV
ncbi:hypothetical protein Nepgr_030949 [Nepenthes gracilis]|uniref:PRA1 family protein n=1 Tax=Nepenthes gracilis TaxID=150966 RepID=A0AAD3THJ4_NEPGR|nr:hypothetical protein Nepgr_030949 [Nepenthes gracilis]